MTHAKYKKQILGRHTYVVVVYVIFILKCCKWHCSETDPQPSLSPRGNFLTNPEGEGYLPTLVLPGYTFHGLQGNFHILTPHTLTFRKYHSKVKFIKKIKKVKIESSYCWDFPPWSSVLVFKKKIERKSFVPGCKSISNATGPKKKRLH